MADRPNADYERNPAKRLAERLSPGTHYIYAANTYLEGRGPCRWTGREMVVKSGKWAKDVDVVGETYGAFRMEIPQSAKAVEWLDDDTVRYAIVGKSEHFVTLHFLAQIDSSEADDG